MSGSYRVTTAGPSGHVEHHIHIRTMRMCLDLSPIQMLIQKHVEILCRNHMPKSYAEILCRNPMLGDIRFRPNFSTKFFLQLERYSDRFLSPDSEYRPKKVNPVVNGDFRAF